MTKLEYKTMIRSYRVAFKSGTYAVWWNKVPSDKFELINRLVESHHLKDYTYLNRLQMYRIWGI